MADGTMSDAAARIGEIDQELAVLRGGSPGRTALDATREDLEVWKEFLGSTAKELKEAKEQIGKSVEGAKDGTSITGPQITSKEAAEHIAGLGSEDSDVDGWISSAQKATEGFFGEFAAAGDVTPESLDKEIEEFNGSFDEALKGLTESASGTTSGIKELLERPDIKKHIDQLTSGVGKGADFASGVNKGIEKVDGILGSLQNLDDLTSGNAQTQLNAAADAFDDLVGLFGDSITMIPGLGAFLSLYGRAFRGAAVSAGVIQGIADRNNKIYDTDRPGKYIVLTDEALLMTKIRGLEEERARLVDAGLAAATEERLARDPINYEGAALDRDVAVEMGIRSANHARPDLNSPAYKNWVASSKNRDTARSNLETARVNLHTAQGELSRAEIATDRPGGTSDAGRDAARLSVAEAGVETAQKKFETAGVEYDTALEQHSEATAAHRSEIDAYDDAVRLGVIEKAAGTHSGQGFSESDWKWFNSAYPQWRVTPADLTPAPAPQVSVVPAAMSAASTTASAGRERNRFVMIAGGGILGMAMLVGGFFLFGNNDTATPPVTQSAVADASGGAETDVTDTTGAQEDPADEPTESSTEVADTPEEPAETASAVAANAGTYEISARVTGVCGSYDVFLRMILFLNGQMTVDQLLTAGGNPFQSATGRWNSNMAVATHADATFYEVWFFLFNLTDILSIYNVYGSSSPIVAQGSEVNLDAYADVGSAQQLDEASGAAGECPTELVIDEVHHTPFPESSG